MSTAPDDPRDLPERAKRRQVALRVMAVLASVGSIFALFVGERSKADRDLQLIVQPAAPPGATIALRALLLTGIDSVQGPQLAPEAVQVSLTDTDGAVLAETQLSPDDTHTMGGLLRLPNVAAGRVWLRARAGGADGPVTLVRAPIRVTEDARALEPEGRLAGPLQHLAAGRLRELDPSSETPALEPRVLGGSCLPEQPCELLVRMGAKAALHVARTASVSVASPPSPAGETEGLVRTTLVVHGPEAETVLRAVQGNTPIAERVLRLPVGLGEVGVELGQSLLEPQAQPRFIAHPPVGRRALLVDAFHEGNWRYTGGVPEPGAEAVLPVELTPGLWRLQVRADPFSSGGSAARALFVRPPGMADDTLLRTLDALSPSGQRVFPGEGPLPGWALADLPATSRFLLSALEQDRVAQPQAVSGRPAQLERLSKTRTLLRFSVGGMLLISALVVSATMVRRELGSQAETRAALREAGDTTIDTPQNLRWQAFWLWSMALGVALAFVLAALLIVAKPLWF